MLAEDDARAWSEMMAILSLDRITPVIRYLELPVPDTKLLQAGFRRILLKYRDELPETSSGHRSPVVNDCFIEIASLFGETIAAAFGRWVQSTYFTPADTDFNSWTLVLIRLMRQKERWQTLSMAPERRDNLYRSCTDAAMMRQEFQNLVDEIKDAELTEWDLAIFTLFGFDDEDDDPLSTIELTVRRVQFFRFWERIEKELSPRELEAFVDMARETGREMSNYAQIGMLRSTDWSVYGHPA